jgi:hypothetical protein
VLNGQVSFKTQLVSCADQCPMTYDTVFGLVENRGDSV